MISRQNGLGLSVVLSLVSFCFCFSAPALAEEEAPSALTPAGSEDAAQKPADAAAQPAAAEPAQEPEKPAEAAAPAPPPAPAAAAAKVEAATAPAAPSPAAAPATASGTSTEREKAVSLVGVELLPGSAYPAVQTRGIKYGSLWQTFHGQQWPYMPLIEGGPKTRIGFSGFFWNDLSYAHIAADKSLAPSNINDQNRWTTQTRGGLRVTPTYNAKDDWFVQGNGEFIVHGDMQPDPVTKVLGSTDDLWVRAGKWNLFDVTFGRFQGWEIANHYGMALDQNTLERAGAWIMSFDRRPTDGYGLTYFWDRQDFMMGGYAVHVYPTQYLRAELLGHVGAGANTTKPYSMDFRPSAIFDIGWVKLKGGWEYGKSIPSDVKSKPRDSRNGYGFAAQFVVDPYVEFGGSLGRGFEDVLDINGAVDLEATNSVTTYGGFLNASPGYEPVVLGVGAFQNHEVDFRIDSSPGLHNGKVDLNDQTQLFGAAQYTLWDCLYLKAVFAYAKNHVEHWKSGIYTNKSYSGRLRAMVNF
jgi:hypothetical protein